MTQANRGPVLRPLVGLGISAIFILLTLSRVDLAEVGAALVAVQPGWIAAAVVVVGVELALRGLRWQRLLRPIARVPLHTAVSYLSIGYLANSILPARLGDLARALLAGRAFEASRLSVLGTIVVERISDGLFIVAVVAVLGLLLAGGEAMAANALWVAVLGLLVAVGFVVLVAYLRTSGGRVRVNLRALLDRVLLGAAAIRSPEGFVQVAILTAAAFAVAVVSFGLVASAAGLSLSPAEAALVMGGLALSTSIPAAPGSVGTYEFVGLTILVSLGVPAETALAVVVLVHLVATLPPALTGLVMAWHLHFRVADIAEAEPLVAGIEAAAGAGAGVDR